jgi:crotonobetainyl-CoA:carnitine CoA-transferase CaiB-like acyl-CoA transferase
MLTVMMADHGAEVIKVEPPAGDPARTMEPFEAGQSVWFRNLNRGKRAVTLDLKTDVGRAALWALIDTADVLVEGFRPGVMDRLGFGYAATATRNPRLVYCSISAFGQSGPLSHHPAHDMAVQAHAGFLGVNDGAPSVDDAARGIASTPVVPGVASSDMAAGLTGLAAVLMALIGRAKSGRGDYLDIAMLDSLLPWCAHTAGSVFTTGESPKSAEQRSLGGAAFYNIYATADGRHVALGGREIKFAVALLTALGRPDLIALAEAPAGAAQQPLIDFLRATFVMRTMDDWITWFADKDVAFAPVLDFAEAFAQPHFAERGLIAEADGAHHVAPAIRFAGESWSPRAAPDLAPVTRD